MPPPLFTCSGPKDKNGPVCKNVLCFLHSRDSAESIYGELVSIYGPQFYFWELWPGPQIFFFFPTIPANVGPVGIPWGVYWEKLKHGDAMLLVCGSPSLCSPDNMYDTNSRSSINEKKREETAEEEWEKGEKRPDGQEEAREGRDGEEEARRDGGSVNPACLSTSFSQRLALLNGLKIHLSLSQRQI